MADDVDAAAPRYALIERERRWLVDTAKCPLDPAARHRLIEDRYIDGSRLRLRRMSDSATGRILLKLTKKYVSSDAAARPIVTTYLTEEEHRLLAALPARSIVKRRYWVDGFSVDCFAFPTVPVIAEIECATAAALAALTPPTWATTEITLDPAYEGGTLAASMSRPT